MVRFYELHFDDDLTRWQLGLARRFADGTPVDIWAYRRCTIVESSRPVSLEVTHAGKEVDYNDTAFSATVVSERLAEIWKSLTPDRIQLLPAEIARSSRAWYVANLLDCVDCIDHARSRIKYCPADDPDRPLKPRSVMRMVITAARRRGITCFELRIGKSRQLCQRNSGRSWRNVVFPALNTSQRVKSSRVQVAAGVSGRLKEDRRGELQTVPVGPLRVVLD